MAGLGQRENEQDVSPLHLYTVLPQMLKSLIVSSLGTEAVYRVGLPYIGRLPASRSRLP